MCLNNLIVIDIFFYECVRAQFNKRLKETFRARISNIIFKIFLPRQGNLLGIRVIRKLEKRPRRERGK